MTRKIEVRDYRDNANYLTTNVDSYDNYFMYTFNRRPVLPLSNRYPIVEKGYDDFLNQANYTADAANCVYSVTP